MTLFEILPAIQMAKVTKMSFYCYMFWKVALLGVNNFLEKFFVFLEIITITFHLFFA